MGEEKKNKKRRRGRRKRRRRRRTLIMNVNLYRMIRIGHARLYTIVAQERIGGVHG